MSVTTDDSIRELSASESREAIDAETSIEKRYLAFREEYETMYPYWTAETSLGPRRLPTSRNERTLMERRLEGTPEYKGLAGRLREKYLISLQEANLLPTSEEEVNWSGKGQHIVFDRHEDIPLRTISSIGSGSTGDVYKVLCKRIAVAQKMVQCRYADMDECMREVLHLAKFKHFHIVQLVGTFLYKRMFSILMYPAADQNLDGFIYEHTYETEPGISYDLQRNFLASCSGCLSSAVEYIHINTTNHLDIKPANILVRKVADDPVGWRVYLTDFGISLTWLHDDRGLTELEWRETPFYCAPEALTDIYSPATDIFSLGCCFAEILTVCAGHRTKELRGSGFPRRESAYHTRIPEVVSWLQGPVHEGLREDWRGDVSGLLTLTKNMLHRHPGSRPSAHAVREKFQQLPETCPFRASGCCDQPAEQYVAYEGEPPEWGPV